MKFPSRIIQRLRRIPIENKGLKALSLFLAILLFALSRQPVSEIRISGVPLVYPESIPGIEITGEVEQTVSVRVRGPRDVVRNLSPNQLAVTAILTNKMPGERVVQLRPENIDTPENVEVLKIEPSSIKLVLENKLRRMVKVNPHLDGHQAEGSEIYNVIANPSMIEIEGPQSIVKEIDIVRTETVNLDSRKESFRIEVDVETPANSVRVITPGRINLEIQVGEIRISKLFIDLPVQSTESTIGTKQVARTADVELKGPKSVIEALSPHDIRVEPNTSGRTGEVDGTALRVRLAENVEKRIEIISIIPKEARVKRR